MGMYTELNLATVLTRPPETLVDTIYDMMQGRPYLPGRMRWMLHTEGSVCFDGKCETHFEPVRYLPDHYALTTRTNIKNYEQEIENFLAIIAPYAEDGYAGTYWYENWPHPQLIFFKDGGFSLVEVEPCR